MDQQQGVTIAHGATTLRLTGGSLEIDASQVKIDAASLQVDAGLSTFSGAVRCSTLITDSVVSRSYTPGAGNIW